MSYKAWEEYFIQKNIKHQIHLILQLYLKEILMPNL